MKKRYYMILAALCAFHLTAAQPADSWFSDAKFGLFLHWGLYSETAGDWNGHPTEGGEHFMLYERIPWRTYATIADRFHAGRFDARAWVRTARRAGMRYVVITAKHHDGFAMFDSPCSDYNIVRRTPFARDPVAELAEACRKEGLRFGVYYSLGRDWQDPDVPTNWPTKGGRSNTWDYPDEDAKVLSRYIERKVKPQLRELLTHYGPIDILWFDTPELVTREQSIELRQLIHSLQPQCIINNRIGNGQGDYRVVEQTLTDRIDRRPWEACLTMGKNWCYNRYDTVYKRPDIQVRLLADIVSKGGNLLLNIGPDGNGCFPRLTRPALDIFHQWMTDNGEAIYSTRPWRVFGETLSGYRDEQVQQKTFHDAVFDATPQEITPDVRYTSKGDTVYAIVRHVTERTFTLTAFTPDDKVRRITRLEDGLTVSGLSGAAGLSIYLPERKAAALPIYVLRIELEPKN